MMQLFFLSLLSVILLPQTYSLDQQTLYPHSHNNSTSLDQIHYTMLDRTPFPFGYEKRVSFYAVGDNLIHSYIFQYAEMDDDTYDFKPIYKNIATDIEEADLSFINFVCQIKLEII